MSVRSANAGAALTYPTLVRAVWFAAILCYVVGDTGSTLVALSLGGYESEPIARAFFEAAGPAGLLMQKALVVGVCAVVWQHYPSIGDVGPDPYRLVIPTVMALRGAWLLSGNLAVISALL